MKQHKYSGDPAGWLLVVVLVLTILALLVAFTARAECGELEAVVQVIGQRGAGSGTVISPEGHVLTAAHVMADDLAVGNNHARIVWRTSGKQAWQRVIANDEARDLALLEPLSALQVAEWIEVAGEGEWPKQGETVELAGYGGGRWRHWSGTVNGYTTHQTRSNDTLSVATRSISGDSGGAILYNGKLVAVLWGGPLAGPQGPMLATHGTCCEAIRPFLAQGCPSCFPSGGCQGGFCPVPRQPPPRPSIDQPPAAPIQKPPAIAPPSAPPAAPPAVSIEWRPRLAALEERIAALEARRPIAGPPGPPGKDGRDGKDGKDGAAGFSPPASGTPGRHFVVVGDPAARYAKRLAEEVAKTAEYFDAIDLVAPPADKNVGTLPALVLYVGSQEAVTYRGTTDVFLQLSRIRRGEFN